MSGIGPFSGKSALIFDLDGTLVETGQIHDAAFRKTLHHYGIDDFDYTRFAGHKTEQVMDQVFAEAGIAAKASLVGEATEKKQCEAQEAISTQIKCVPGAIEFLRLAERIGYRLAIGTGASRKGAELSLKSAHMAAFFEVIVTGDDVKRGKPAPDIFLKAINKFGVNKDECVVFEDSPPGLVAARAAGLDVLILETASPCFADTYGHVDYFDFQALSRSIIR